MKGNRKKKIAIIGASIIIALLVAGVAYAKLFGPVDTSASAQDFFVSDDMSKEQIAHELKAKGFIRYEWVFEIAYARKAFGNKILPGGYEISASDDAWTIASTLLEPPYYAFIRIPVGWRKEQIADKLADTLGWSDVKKQAFLNATNANGSAYQEGVYYPDTYFIPSDMPPQLVEAKIRARFMEVFEPYSKQAVAKKIPWQNVLTIASLIQREAGSVNDMKIISGVIKRRLAVGMPLAIDATLQYIGGNAEDGWWAPPAKASSYPDSPFNTYKRAGLPPHPIAEPSLAAIDAALNPIQTDCLFYIHDNNGVMHCSPTYAGQKANVAKYLK